MLRKEFASEANRGERLAARIMTQFLLRYCEGMARLAGGDLMNGLIIAAILDANVGHLATDATDDRQFGGAEAVVPDEQRVPITISALSRKLSFPYETIRRHVNGLVDQGVCARGERGVYVREAWLRDRIDVATALYVSLRLMMQRLHAAGFDLQAMASAPISDQDLKRLGL